MSATLTGTRLSELARCPRMASLRALGDAEAPIDEEWNRYFARGQLFEQYAYWQFAAKHGNENVQRQRTIPWAHGEGHADLYILPHRELVEVKSSVSPGGDIFDDAIRQVGLYLMHDLEAERAGIYLINPSSLAREDFLPVKLTSDLRDELEQRLTALTRAVETNGDDLPDCVCSTPGECRHRGCPFTEAAWEGWQPAPPVELADADALALVENLHMLKTAYRNYTAEAEERRQGYTLVQAQLAALGVECGRDYRIGPYKLRRVVSKGRETFSLAKARQTGNWPPELDEALSAFISVSEGSERWSVEKVASSEAAPVGFGDEAPF